MLLAVSIMIVPFILFVILYMFRTANLNYVIYQNLYLASLPQSFENTKFFFISDLHRRVISKQVIEDVGNHADFVIIGGDLVEKNVPMDRVETNLMRLKKIGPIYFVWGNNDYEVDTNKLLNVLVKHNVTILANTAVTITSKGGENIKLIGIDDITMERDRLDSALEMCNDSILCRILVSHNPNVKKQMVKEHRISLVLSGHTHGGQIRLFGFGLYPLGGIETTEDCMYVVSNGYGTSAIPLRLGATPETHVFCLKKAQRTAVGKRIEKQF